jgi:hypothetical protein
LFAGRERRDQRRHRGFRVVQHESGQQVDVVGVDPRLVALDVDHNIRVGPADGLRDPIRSAVMFGRGQDALGAELPRGLHDLLVVGRDHHALGQPGLARLFPRMLDEVLAGVFGENLRGKSCGRVASRNTNDNLHVTQTRTSTTL